MKVFDRVRFEKETIEAMVRMYCNDHHGKMELCAECRELLDYSFNRVDHCPFLPSKPVCSRCLVHCYRKSMAARVKEVMRYAGPRMLKHHPVKALLYLIIKKTVQPRMPAQKSGPVSPARSAMN